MDKSPIGLPGQRRARWCLLAWCSVIVLGHAVLLDSGFNNLEFAFADAARYFAKLPRDGHELERYWANQANPLGYSLVTSIWLRIVGNETTFWVFRMPAILGGICVIWAGFIWSSGNNDSRERIFPTWCAAVACNPLIWCYAGQATADVLPAGMILMAFALCRLASDRPRAHLLPAAIFAASCVVKFNSLLLFPAFAAIPLFSGDRNNKAFKTMLVAATYAVLPLTTLAIYWTWIYKQYNIVILPEKFKAIYSDSAMKLHYQDVFWSYVSYLAMACLPFSAVAPVSKFWRLLASQSQLFPRHQNKPKECGGLFSDWGLFAFSAICSAAGIFGMLSMKAGEMDQGVFDALAPPHTFDAVKAICLFLGAYMIGDWAIETWRRRSSIEFAMLAAVIPYLVVSSCTRPAQRYLILIIPFVMWRLINAYSRQASKWTRMMEYSGIALFILASSLGSVYLSEQGSASDRMARWIVSRQLQAETDPNAISQHAGQYFSSTLTANPRYIVTADRALDSLHTERVSIFGFCIREYSLVPVSKKRQNKPGANGETGFDPG